MAFQINTNRFASFRTYEDAELYFNHTPAIRGHDKDIVGVPLRDDRAYWQAYSLKKDPMTGDYMVRMYSTAIATFKPDGTTSIDASYGSNSTNALVENYTPRGEEGFWARLYTRNGRPIVWFNHQAFWANKPIVFKDGEIVNKQQLAVEKQVLNRKRAKETRAKLQPFMDYTKTMRALSAGGMDSEALPEWEGNISVGEHDYTNPDNFPRLLRPYFIGLRTAAFLRNTAETEILEAAYEREGAYDWLPLAEGTIHKTMRYVVWNEPNL